LELTIQRLNKVALYTESSDSAASMKRQLKTSPVWKGKREEGMNGEGEERATTAMMGHLYVTLLIIELFSDAEELKIVQAHRCLPALYSPLP